MTVDRPRFQQAVYDQGHTDGRLAGFKSGEIYGRVEQKMEDEFKPALGFVLGMLASTIAVCAAKLMGWLA